MTLTMFAQSAVDGLTTGMVYVVVALGLTLVFGVMDIVNFAHGEMFMLGAIVLWFLSVSLGITYIVALLMSAIIIAILGVLIERLFYRPFRGRLLDSFIVALALVTIIPNAVSNIAGPFAKAVPSPLPGTLQVQGLTLSLERMAVVVASFLLVAGLFAFIQWHKAGKAMRAVAQDPEAAALQGVSIDRTSSICMALGCGLAAAAAGLITPIFSATPWMGGEVIMKSFIIIIIGGLGSIPGAVLGGLLLGFLESFGTLFVSLPVVSLFGFVLIIVVLLARPKGLLGRA